MTAKGGETHPLQAGMGCKRPCINKCVELMGEEASGERSRVSEWGGGLERRGTRRVDVGETLWCGFGDGGLRAWSLRML